MDLTTLALEQRLVRLAAVGEIKQLKARHSHYRGNGYDRQGVASRSGITVNGLSWVQLSKGAKPSCATTKNCPTPFPILGVFRNKCVKIDGKWLFAQVRADIQQSALWTEGGVKNPPVKDFFKMD